MKPPLEFHARLVEEAVWAGIRDHPRAALFHLERERLYAPADAEEIDLAFARFHATWFRRLGLEAPVVQALEEQTDALASVRLVLAAPARQPGEQGAELFVSDSGERTVVLKLRPDLLVRRDAALALLRRELLHVADMLDPAFAYEPVLPRHARGPAHDRTLRERYRILWDCSVDGRLARSHRISGEERGRRLEEFRGAFLCLGDRSEECFERIWSGPRPLHGDLAALASDPEAAFGLRSAISDLRDRCPLCGFPTLDFEPGPGGLPEIALSAIRSDFPAWRAEAGVCRQCADLYRTRSLSLSAADLLPGAGAGKSTG